MKKFRMLSLVMAVAMCFTLLAGCSDSASGDDDTITIALIANTTGDYAMYGVPVANGALLYINELNEAGGINGKTIEVLQYDDKGDGAESVNAFNLAMENGATAVIGSVLTGATITLADATYDEGVPQITASATAAGVTMIDPDDADSEIRTNVFRSCFIDPFQGEKMAEYSVEELGATTAAILYQTGNDYSEGLMESFVEKAAELGLEIVATEAFAEGDVDYKAQMTNIAAAGADVVFLPFYYTEAALAISQGREAGVTGTFMGADGMSSVSSYADADVLEGTVYCSGYAPGTADVADFEAAYLEAYGEEVPNMYAPLAYDAAMLLCNAIEAADSAGLTAGSDEFMEAVIAELGANNATAGITGTYTFDEYNNPIKSAAIMEVQNGVETYIGNY